MAATDNIHSFNLKAVLLETGLKADTLRAWERRYGLPEPGRSAGGHRLYSQRDIDIIKWLMERQQEGLSISRAVDLWRGLEGEGRDPLRMAEFGTPVAATTGISLPTGDAILELRQAWVAACLAFDEQGAERVVAQAFALYPPEAVCLELLQKGLAELGAGWYQGQVSVQQEHFGSELAIRRLEAQIAASPPPTRRERILIGCPPEEEHTFSPLLLTLFLKRGGLKVLYLGANVPIERLEVTLRATDPNMLIMPAQQLHTAASLLEAAHAVRDQAVPVAYGGLIFNLLPELRRRIPGHFLGEELKQAAHKVESLLASPPKIAAAEPVSEASQVALQHYLERRVLIEPEVWHAMQSQDISVGHLTIASSNLARNIEAALTLGDVDFIGVNIEWVAGLLSHQRLPVEMLEGYLAAYYQAAQRHLDERGAPLLDWLARVSGNRPEE